MTAVHGFCQCRSSWRILDTRLGLDRLLLPVWLLLRRRRLWCSVVRVRNSVSPRRITPGQTWRISCCRSLRYQRSCHLFRNPTRPFRCLRPCIRRLRFLLSLTLPRRLIHVLSHSGWWTNAWQLTYFLPIRYHRHSLTTTRRLHRSRQMYLIEDYIPEKLLGLSSFCTFVFYVAGLRFGCILYSGPLLGAPVFLTIFVNRLPVLYRPSRFYLRVGVPCHYSRVVRYCSDGGVYCVVLGRSGCLGGSFRGPS